MSNAAHKKSSRTNVQPLSVPSCKIAFREKSTGFAGELSFFTIQLALITNYQLRITIFSHHTLFAHSPGQPPSL
jgi:hypothetical protein